jgi:hypothetical protein
MLMPNESTDEEWSSTSNAAGQLNRGNLVDSVEGSEGLVPVVPIKNIVVETRGVLTLSRKNEVFMPGALAGVALMIESAACLQWLDGQTIELLRTDIVVKWTRGLSRLY